MRRRPTLISLFSGAGGLDLGFEAAGYETRLCVEIDVDACLTLSHNRPEWRLANPGDIHAHKPESLLSQAGLGRGELDVLVGGPPCQPFSKSGYWSTGDSGRLEDPRSKTLRAFLNIMEAALPKVVLIENVNGLAFSGKDEGIRLIQRAIAGINKRNNTKYNVQVFHLNSADYGVPQFRERVFIVANKRGKNLNIPRATHGDDDSLLPFATAWDAIGDLDCLKADRNTELSGKWADLLPSIPEGQNYLWHTPQGGGEPLFGWRTRYWSFLLKLAKNRPSWTIQASPGPATGPFHWRNRLLTTRELCRLQTFPDDYEILGDPRSARRQIGNAVPSALAELLGQQIKRQLLNAPWVYRTLSLIPNLRYDCPRRSRMAIVPKRFLSLRGNHKPHPGNGLGPGILRRDKLLENAIA